MLHLIFLSKVVSINPLKPSSGALPGVADLDLDEEMLPQIEEIVSHYSNVRGVQADFDLDFYLSFCFFRLAAIAQGSYFQSLHICAIPY